MLIRTFSHENSISHCAILWKQLKKRKITKLPSPSRHPKILRRDPLETTPHSRDFDNIAGFHLLHETALQGKRYLWIRLLFDWESLNSDAIWLQTSADVPRQKSLPLHSEYLLLFFCQFLRENFADMYLSQEHIFGMSSGLAVSYLWKEIFRFEWKRGM